MIYNEIYIGIATTVSDLINTLINTKIPNNAAIEVAGGDRAPDVEVWYDKDTNTVILK